MKELKNFIITISLTGILTIIGLIIASKIFIPKWIDHNNNMMSFIIKGFYKEQKNSLDVIFMGNSDVYRGVSPMKLYEEMGVTSYNFVSAGQRMWIAKPILEEALRFQTPKVIFFNVDSVFYTHVASDGNYHKVYDNMPLSLNKITGVFDSNYASPKSKKLTHFLPILMYHNRYSELTKEDIEYAFYDYSNPLKGMDLVASKIPYTQGNYYMSHNDDNKVDIPTKNKEYLDNMLELCNKKNIELILMELPSAESWSNEKSAAISEYAKEKNIKFIDMNLDAVLAEMNFNWLEDTSDGGDHLNIFGAEKTTTYLANYLKENYNFENHKNDNNYSNWNKQYEEYLKFKDKEIEIALK